VRSWLLIGWVALLLGTGCAPTTLSPMIMRLTPTDATAGETTFGLRTGPRLSVPVAPSTSGGIVTAPFAGDSNIFSVPQWGMAYDLAYHAPIDAATTAHLGVQGEFYYPIVLPAVGAYVGVSRYFTVGQASIAPAAVGRFTTDFGLPSGGGPSSQAGGELSLALAWHPEDRVTVGLVPFGAYQHVWVNGSDTYGIYTGGVVAVRIRYASGLDAFEISGGYGRVFMPNGIAWSTPILGVRFVR